MRGCLIPCDGSEFGFRIGQDGTEWVAVLYFRGEPLRSEFREATPELLKLAMAEWVARLSADARALQ